MGVWDGSQKWVEPFSVCPPLISDSVYELSSREIEAGRRGKGERGGEGERGRGGEGERGRVGRMGEGERGKGESGENGRGGEGKGGEWERGRGGSGRKGEGEQKGGGGRRSRYITCIYMQKCPIQVFAYCTCALCTTSIHVITLI